MDDTTNTPTTGAAHAAPNAHPALSNISEVRAAFKRRRSAPLRILILSPLPRREAPERRGD